jgi:hypothetical protein
LLPSAAHKPQRARINAIKAAAYESIVIVPFIPIAQKAYQVIPKEIRDFRVNSTDGSLGRYVRGTAVASMMITFFREPVMLHSVALALLRNDPNLVSGTPLHLIEPPRKFARPQLDRFEQTERMVPLRIIPVCERPPARWFVGHVRLRWCSAGGSARQPGAEAGGSGSA